MADYLPVAPKDDSSRRHNQNLPALGGVFYLVNLSAYHFSTNNPLKYTDPDGRIIRKVAESPRQQESPLPLGTSQATIRDVGCVLTATLRIANEISGKNTSLETANAVALKSGLFVDNNLLTIEGQAKLIGLLTGKEIGAAQYSGSEAQLSSVLLDLERSPTDYFVSGRINATNANGTERYGHQVNIDPFIKLNNSSLGQMILSLFQGYQAYDPTIRINDTSTAGRTTTHGRVQGMPENLFRLNVFWVKERE